MSEDNEDQNTNKIKKNERHKILQDVKIQGEKIS